MSEAIQLAGTALNGGHHIRYLSDVDSFAILGLIDASECPPTYGADFNDVKGYIRSSWDTMKNREGNLSEIDHIYKVDFPDFAREVTAGDLVLVLHLATCPVSSDLLSAIKHATAQGWPYFVLISNQAKAPM
jgi:N-acetylmuramic acid 6-phosphate (MurNAc-6-P) etherase